MIFSYLWHPRFHLVWNLKESPIWSLNLLHSPGNTHRFLTHKFLQKYPSTALQIQSCVNFITQKELLVINSVDISSVQRNHVSYPQLPRIPEIIANSNQSSGRKGRILKSSNQKRYTMLYR